MVYRHDRDGTFLRIYQTIQTGRLVYDINGTKIEIQQYGRRLYF